jgi:hypothetical protein
LRYLNKWYLIVYQKKISRIKQYKYKNRTQLNFVNKNNVCNRLYEDAKYKQSYLSALKLLYQLKEYKDCPFQPKINRGNYYFYNDNSFLLNNKINKLNRQRRNCITNEFEKSNSSININYLNNNYINNNKNPLDLKKFNNEKSIFNSGNSSFYNAFTKTQISPLSLSNKYLSKNDSRIFYSNNFSDLNSKLTFQYNKYRSPQNEKRTNLSEGILAGRISNNIYSVPIESNEQLFINSFNKVNPINDISAFSAKNSRSKFNIIYNKNIQNSNSSSIGNSNNFILFEEKEKNKKIESYNYKNNMNNNLELEMNTTYEKKNIKNSNNISNSTGTNDKYSLVFEQLSVRAAYQKDNHVTLQSIPDDLLFSYAGNYIDSDQSLERFRLNIKKKKI